MILISFLCRFNSVIVSEKPCNGGNTRVCFAFHFSYSHLDFRQCLSKCQFLITALMFLPYSENKHLGNISVRKEIICLFAIVLLFSV